VISVCTGRCAVGPVTPAPDRHLGNRQRDLGGGEASRMASAFRSVFTARLSLSRRGVKEFPSQGWRHPWIDLLLVD
jgi:hypothetical protein